MFIPDQDFFLSLIWTPGQKNTVSWIRNTDEKEPGKIQRTPLTYFFPCVQCLLQTIARPLSTGETRVGVLSVSVRHTFEKI
jgi:hypothetical protein